MSPDSHTRSGAKSSGGPGASGNNAAGNGAAGKGFAGSKASERPRTVDATPPGPEEQLVAKLRRIEALHARPGSEGERVAAERARQRILERLQQLEASEPPVEFRFSLADQWSRHLFVALLRR